MNRAFARLAHVYAHLIAHDADMGLILPIQLDIAACQRIVAYPAGTAGAITAVVADRSGKDSRLPSKQPHSRRALDLSQDGVVYGDVPDRSRTGIVHKYCIIDGAPGDGVAGICLLRDGERRTIARGMQNLLEEGDKPGLPADQVLKAGQELVPYLPLAAV